MVSLGSNLPILKRDLDIRGLLLKSMELSKLKIIVPIICNILIGLKSSSFFAHHVPYVASLLDLLKEIQKQPQLI